MYPRVVSLTILTVAGVTLTSARAEDDVRNGDARKTNSRPAHSSLWVWRQHKKMLTRVSPDFMTRRFRI
jgi:hypothetical protein